MEISSRFAGPAAGEKGPPQAKRGAGCPRLHRIVEMVRTVGSRQTPESDLRFAPRTCWGQSFVLLIFMGFYMVACVAAHCLQGPPQAKKARRRRNGVRVSPPSPCSGDGAHSRQTPELGPNDERFRSPKTAFE